MSKAPPVTARPPPRAETFGEFMYKPETGEVMGRTCVGWLKLLVFYAIFYACLTGFFIAMYCIFNLNLDKDVPKYFNTESLQRDYLRNNVNPGVGFRPLPTYSTTLIYYKRGDKASSAIYTENLTGFLKLYGDKPTDNVLDCSFPDEPKQVTSKSVCNFDPKQDLGECSLSDGTMFGYDDQSGGPCIILKLNRVFGWEPEPYSCFDEETCKQEGMSQEDYKFLTVEYKSLVDTNGQKTVAEFLKDFFKEGKEVPFSCSGIYPADKENIQSVTHANGGVPKYYFPYMKQESYRQPLVAVRVKTTPGVLVLMECKAWAQNIDHYFLTRDGSVHIELLIQ